MKKGHAGFWVGISVFLIAVVYSVVLFLVKPSLDDSSRVLYVATIIAFLLFGMQAIASSRSKSAIVTESALGIVTAIYFGLQLIGGGILCMSFKSLPFTPVVISEIILLSAYLVFAFVMFAAQSSNAAQDHNDQKAVRRMRLLEDDVLELMDDAANPEVKKALKNLAEEVHFSDVVFLPALVDIDHLIARDIAILQAKLNDDDANVLTKIEEIDKLLRERKRIAAISKH